MTSPLTYPPGPISQWGQNLAATGQYTSISYIGVDGTIFYLTGPHAPVPGAQDGIALVSHMGLMAPWDSLELKGARQDGATFQDAVYDPGEIVLHVEASGVGPQNIRDVIRHWISAWDAKQTGLLSVFTPDMGEWWANVQMGKNIADVFSYDYTSSLRQRFTWNIKNYGAFWQSTDSVAGFNIAYASESFAFASLGNSNNIPTGFTQTYSSPGNGTYGVQNGAAQWVSPNGTPNTVVNIANTTSVSNNQVVSIQLAGPIFAELFSGNLVGGYLDIWARANSTGTTGVRLRLGLVTQQLSYFINGVEYDLYPKIPMTPLIWNDVITLTAGTNNNVYDFKITRNGIPLWSYTDSAQVTPLGNLFWGFGSAYTVTLGVNQTPPPVALFSASDNHTQAQTGQINLTNYGDQPAWPRYLLYGPGTFGLPNPFTNTIVTLGPLLQDQIVLVTTDPQYRSVVDLSPNQPPQQLTQFQALLQQLISFATNNNVPPLLQQFESKFGIVPPQGNLYQLLNGRFTNPIPGSFYGQAPTTVNLPVQMTNAGPTSNVIAALTPLKRWPL